MRATKMLMCAFVFWLALAIPGYASDQEATKTEPAPVVTNRYQVATAKEDGTFAAEGEYPSLEEAVSAAKGNANRVVRDMNRTKGNGVVYMSEGQVITTPSKVGGVILTYGNEHYNTYVAEGYDAQLVSTNGVDVTIQLMGMKGAVVKAKSAQPIDQVELVPPAHIEAVSYYENKDGQLTHVLQSFRYDKAENGWSADAYRIYLGPAPEFMKPETRYYSYSASAFYTDRAQTNSVGNFEPYYKNLSFRTQTVYTAEELDAYIASWNQPKSKLMGVGKDLKRLESEYGINALMLLAMASHESAKGMSEIAQTKNNLFGVRATDDNPLKNATEFKTVAEALEYQAKEILAGGYLNAPESWRYHGPHVGDKFSGLNVKYASDPYWGEKITGHLTAIDKFLGGKDYGRYTIGWTEGKAEAYADADLSGDALYDYYNVGGAFPASVPVSILGEENGVYTTPSLMPEAPGQAVYVDGDSISISYKGSGVEPMVQAASKNTDIIRLAGENRYATAIEIAKQHRENAKTVFLANGVTQIDALSAAPYAYHLQAPLLLTPGAAVDAQLKQELSRLGAKRIIIVGGTKSVSALMEETLRETYEVERIQGANRYETSAKIAERLQKEIPGLSHVFVANGISAVDALSIGPVAAQKGAPILLTDGKRVDPSVEGILQGKKSITAIGGNNSVSDVLCDEWSQNAEVSRIAGANRYKTSAAIAEQYVPRANAVVFATGQQLADGLAGATLAASYEAPLLLVDDQLQQEVSRYIDGQSYEKVLVLGGENSVKETVVKQISNTIK